MGLDMYLKGEKFNWTDWKQPEDKRRPMMDGYEVEKNILQLGYWRKHPNLHGYIVQEFAEGKDECQKIELYVEDLEKIIKAIETKSLPSTSGFFFGASDGSEDEESIKIIKKAIKWAKTKETNVSRSVYYQASW